MCLFFVFSIDFVLNYKTSNVDICAQIQYKANTFNKSEMQDKLEKKRSVHHPAAPPHRHPENWAQNGASRVAADVVLI